jgi:Ca2+-binding EF-hand superfamily protein
MRWTAIVTGLAALAAVVFPAGGWAGQSRERDRELNIRFAQMDLNRDGVIDRKEWRGSAQSFRVHDWNGDGVLSNEEVRVGARRAERAGQPGPFDGWDREYEFTDWTQRGFERLDRNRDGRISRQEFPFERASFNRADHNRDGVLSRGEFLGGDDPNQDDDREDPFWNLDVNRDNRVDEMEWHGTRARFQALDDNRDGYLTPSELAGTAEPPPDLFASVDRNKDGAVTRDEWYWDDASFKVRDVNGDGRISRDEVNRTGGTTPAQVQAHKMGFDRGLSDGRTAGQQDRERNWGWNLEGRLELERADFGYRNEMNARAEYQAGYRSGFRQGYREGYERR